MCRIMLNHLDCTYTQQYDNTAWVGDVFRVEFWKLSQHLYGKDCNNKDILTGSPRHKCGFRFVDLMQPGQQLNITSLLVLALKHCSSTKSARNI